MLGRFLPCQSEHLCITISLLWEPHAQCLDAFYPAEVSINVLQFPYHGSHMLNAWTLYTLPE